MAKLTALIREKKLIDFNDWKPPLDIFHETAKKYNYDILGFDD